MSVMYLVVGLAVIGTALWVINAVIPMEATIKRIINVVVIIVAFLWVLSAFGILGHLFSVRVPQIR